MNNTRNNLVDEVTQTKGLKSEKDCIFSFLGISTKLVCVMDLGNELP